MIIYGAWGNTIIIQNKLNASILVKTSGNIKFILNIEQVQNHSESQIIDKFTNDFIV